jgi:predicted peptidase
MDRRTFMVAGAGLSAAVGVAGLSAGQASADTDPTTKPGSGGSGIGHVRTVTAITQVFGSGQKLTAVSLEFDRAIDSSKLSTSTFSVADRTVTKVYANRSEALATRGRDGRFVIIELSPDDAAALLWVNIGGGQTPPGSSPTPSASATASPSPSETPTAAPTTSPSGGAGGPGAGGPQVGDNTPGGKIVVASATVTQHAVVVTVDGLRYVADSTTSLLTTKVKNLIVDDFEQFSFTDPATGRTLTYNLFIPHGYDSRRRYPLVLFMHDASVVNVATEGPLVQGDGAVVWASPEDQAKHPCFVLAPEYPEVVIADDYQPSTYFDATVNLLNKVVSEYSIDAKRLYSTGQSMGAMMTLGINIRHPGLLAASYVVAGQWPDDQAGPLVGKKLWVTVSEGDTKAFPMENAIMAVLRAHGVKVAEAQWDARWTAAQFVAAARALEAQRAPVNYAHFAAGTLPGSSAGGGSEHTGTWKVAYDIPQIRDWIMRQSL